MAKRGFSIIKKDPTRDRIRMAINSINKMRRHYINDDQFFDYFELFLIRTRSIIDYFEEQNNLKRNPPNIYIQEKQILQNKTLYKVFNKFRNTDVHDWPKQILAKYISPNGSSSRRCTVDYINYVENADPNYDPNFAILEKRFLKGYEDKEIIQCSEMFLDLIRTFLNNCKIRLNIS